MQLKLSYLRRSQFYSLSHRIRPVMMDSASSMLTILSCLQRIGSSSLMPTSSPQILLYIELLINMTSFDHLASLYLIISLQRQSLHSCLAQILRLLRESPMLISRYVFLLLHGINWFIWLLRPTCKAPEPIISYNRLSSTYITALFATPLQNFYNDILQPDVNYQELLSSTYFLLEILNPH